jgi:6-pyruvoyltetrahydropterin/6-carboxytetrahydropterin synthase
VEDEPIPTAVVTEFQLEFDESQLEVGTRREVILEAIEELPEQLQQVARLRVLRDDPLGEIARDIELTASQATEILSQAQAVLVRTVGPEFIIEYIPETERAILPTVVPPVAEIVPEPAIEEPSATPADESDLAAAIRAPLDALTVPLLGTQDSVGEAAVAQSTIREALRDASAIFRLAAERLGEDESEHPLRRLLADESSDEIRIIADGLTEPALYLVELDGLSSTRWARVETKEENRTIFAVEAISSSALVRDVMGLESPFRPIRLVVRENEIEVGLPPEASTGITPAQAVGIGSLPVKTQPIFELGADAFFGARHFVTMGGVQGPPHHHSFRVEALMDAPAQDSDGVVLGFGEARRLVEDIVLDYNESLLNTVEPFNTIQPTSENIAKVIFERLKAQLNTNDIRLKQVRVWESPTNSASYSDAVLAV